MEQALPRGVTAIGHRRRWAGGVAAAALVAVLLSGCAPEPGTLSPDGTDLTQKEEPEGGSWAEENPQEAYDKSRTLPETFPAEFVVPDGAVIDDAGARGGGSWYVVLSAEDAEAATATWDAVIRDGGFAVADEAETGDGGRSATLTSATLSVNAVTLPGEGGATLLSYDITSSDR